MEGIVLEKGSRQPIEGALVVARWQGTGGYTTTTCFHVESTVSDKRGKYHFPAWENTGKWNNLRDQTIITMAYKPGYEGSDRQERGVEYLKPFTGTREERLGYLLRISSHSCFSEKYKELIPYNEAIYNEAISIAETKEDKEITNRIRFYLDVVKYGWDEADKRADKKKGVRKIFKKRVIRNSDK